MNAYVGTYICMCIHWTLFAYMESYNHTWNHTIIHGIIQSYMESYNHTWNHASTHGSIQAYIHESIYNYTRQFCVIFQLGFRLFRCGAATNYTVIFFLLPVVFIVFCRSFRWGNNSLYGTGSIQPLAVKNIMI